MINMFLFVFCLVNSHIVDSDRGTFQDDLVRLEKVNTDNYAGAILEVESGNSFYGVSGTVTVYKPIVEKEQISYVAMMVINKSPNNLNAIIVGWHVNPKMYNDDKTHLFAYWASNNLQRGCTNLQCQGFVQTDKSIILGQSFNQTSTIDGLMVELPLAILQDPKSKNWWIYINEKAIGYYPGSLFSNMTYVDQVAWFGKTTNPTYTPSPPMGFGTLPNGVLGHACYFKDLVFVNNFRQQQKLTKNMGQVQSPRPQCYTAAYYEDNQIGLSLQFGGPGGSKCSMA